MIKENLEKFKSTADEFPKGKLIFYFDLYAPLSFCDLMYNSSTHHQITRYNGKRIVEIRRIFDYMRDDL